MPHKIDIKMVAARMKMLADAGRLFGTAGKSLAGAAAAHHKALIKLNAAVDGLKPKPDKNVELNKIRELQAKLHTEAVARSYELAQKQDELTAGALSAVKQRKIMLNNLVEIGKAAVEQHTGGNAADIGSRPGTRQIFMALKSLKDSSAHLDTVEKTTKTLGHRKSRISEKTTVWDLKELINEADTAVKVAKTIEDALASYEDEVSKGTKELKSAVETAAA